MLIRSHTINSLLKLHVVCFFCFVFCIVHGSLNLDVVSLVIRLIAAIYCTHVYWVTHDSGISPFWFALYKLHNFLVNMSFVYLLVFAIKWYIYMCVSKSCSPGVEIRLLKTAVLLGVLADEGTNLESIASHRRHGRPTCVHLPSSLADRR